MFTLSHKQYVITKHIMSRWHKRQNLIIRTSCQFSGSVRFGLNRTTFRHRVRHNLSKEILYEEVGKQCIIFPDTVKEPIISFLERGGYLSPASSKNYFSFMQNRKQVLFWTWKFWIFFLNFSKIGKLIFIVFAYFRSIYFFYTILLQHSKNTLFP